MSMKTAILNALDQALTAFTAYPALRQALSNEQTPTHVLAIGKAAYRMAEVAAMAIPTAKLASCLVLSKYGFYPENHQDRPFSPILLEAGHPLPDANSLKHSRFILDWMEQIPPQDQLVVLLSGGTSALFEAPRGDISLQELIQQNDLLLRSGLDIAQINQARQKLSLVKSGQAAQHYKGQKLRVYLLSDVPANDPAIIGSGPFFLPGIDNHSIIADNSAFLKSLATPLHKALPDLPLRLAKRFVDEELTSFAKALARFAPKAQPGIYLWGGELTLKVKGTGRGGRLSHLALSFLNEIKDQAGLSLIAFATDGNDHLPELAGAYVDRQSYLDLHKENADIPALLKTFDSYPPLKLIDAIIPAHYTGCNVNDVFILIKTAHHGTCLSP
jgi:hydroxypyruvate reductase